MTKTLIALAAAFALTGVPAIHAQTAGAASATNASSSRGDSTHGSKQLHESMSSGMQKMQAMQPTGDTDKDFAMMMRMHHQQAVEMAQAEIQHGKSAELKKMAQKMVKDQQKEIKQLDDWLAKHK
jgi:uncharacterized protein (DUF305 family)